MAGSEEAAVDFNFGTGERGNVPKVEPLTEIPAPVERRVNEEEPSWLANLGAGLDDGGADEPEPDEIEDEPQDEEEDPRYAGMEPELVEHLKGGGDLDSYYRQKYAPQPAEEPKEEKPREVIELETVQAGVAETREKMRENRRTMQHAMLNGASQQQMDALEDEYIDLQRGLQNLTARESFVNEKLQQRTVSILQSEYESEFERRLVTDHGRSQAEAKRVRAAVMQNELIAGMMANPQTHELMKIPLVREVFTKAALYDMQYGSKSRRKGPQGDPGVAGGRPSTPGTVQPRRAPANPIPGDDRGFADFISGNRKKDGKK